MRLKIREAKPGAAMVGLTEKAFIGLLALFLVMAALLFGAAGTFDYWQAWVFLAVLFSASFALTLYLVKMDPALRAADARRAVGPALDRRFGWSHMRPATAFAGHLLVALDWLGVFVVFRENSYTSATIELAPGQKAISTSPYALVRYPMYSSAMIMLLGVPIALGSWWGVLPLVVMSPALVWRLFNEERFLEANLPGYASYRATVRYRLIPHVW